jgi:hypothetical protein
MEQSPSWEANTSSPRIADERDGLQLWTPVAKILEGNLHFGGMVKSKTLTLQSQHTSISKSYTFEHRNVF